MKIDVFVSYHTDTASDVAEAVVAKLEQQGLRCWYAPRDAEGRFAGVIKRAIDRSSIFVVLLNKAASDSRHVKNEIAIAFDNEALEIIPLRITNEAISDDVDYYLHSFNHINAVGDRRGAGMDELTNRILKKLNRPAPASAKPAPRTETIKYDDGCVYTGEVVNGKHHGKGKLVWPNGDRYEGDFADGKVCGTGTYYHSNGNIYKGDWKNGKGHGKGTFTWPSGARYEGDFVDGKFHGTGTYYYPDGSIYKGDWKDDKRTGKGTYIWPDGDRYEGDYVNGERTGYGTYTHADGKVESGRFENGKYLGK